MTATDYRVEANPRLADEVRALLASPLTRRFLCRLIYEMFRVQQTQFQYNASVYGRLELMAEGGRLKAFCQAVDFDGFQLAEREYFLNELRRNDTNREDLNG